ncbi:MULTISPECIES: helix-turn-helix domain-containing protein [unclassified Streptomyces]|uniref:helix-turn-helix domain-containing protein n=1 Tax=unclassified Streptomyces TaxID=2593676 RepID=UPI002DD803AE|nr:MULTISPECIES: helix-turn-helix domain-containing protein [unclassified Streptomyces]WSF81754.1 helix-turn-helix domain-containing protein [Streptomyces sp. NBC_01744]WSC34121.1 helix-turn-helix domain-containing protein [Streptomyces sp. NBC_01763]WSC41937.1 helix-turn-helix domain-containing protein [Streptomyces sp. NBC_01763]WSC50919.1 helix-turn-helix domain-containing protein [Streptomyces sp. NBC_01761]WSC58602.1 helix-turn-helix domain-containing protein [Streptomyces sp. NBC_01761]
MAFRFADLRMAGLVDESRRGRRKSELVLSEAERVQLTCWAKRAKTAQFLALRAKIVLRCAEGGTNKQVATELGVAQTTVNRWRSRFVTDRLGGLMDEQRPGRPPSILLDQVEDVVVATLESTPGKDTHWSRASMAKRTGLSKSTIGRIWKRFDLKPHLQDSFKGCPVIPGGRTTTATAPRRVVGTPEYDRYEDAPPPCDAPHLTPRADPPGITGQPLTS